MKTFVANKQQQKPRWYVVDADGKVLGRLAVRVANMLRGKDKPTYTSHVDTGDFVVVVNANKVVLTGRKETNKKYMTYSGFVGGAKVRTAAQVRARRPEILVERAVRGMVPHTRLGRQVMQKLKVYSGPDHPHTAQKPEAISW